MQKYLPTNKYLTIFPPNCGRFLVQPKRFCMKCRKTSHIYSCCGEPTHCLTKSARPPRKEASEKKWQTFIEACVYQDRKHSLNY